MSYLPGPDAEELRGVVRTFLEKRSPEAAVREVMETPDGFDRDVWHKAATELGLHGLLVPEEQGGSGASLQELGVVFEEAGRALWCAPFLAHAFAVNALLAAGSDPSELATGLVATVAWGGDDPERSTITASDGVLTGTADYVLDGMVAELVLVTTPTGLYAVRSGTSGVHRTPQPTMDLTRRLASLRFDGAPAEHVGSADGFGAALDRTILLLAAEQLGVAGRALEMAVEYAGQRVQFGRAIGSFQAVKHALADVLVDVEAARSVVYHGLWTAVHEPEQLPVAASLARAQCCESVLHAVTTNIQVHGGIGFTWEHPAHLYLKRAKGSALLFGSATEHRTRLADALGIGVDGGGK